MDRSFIERNRAATQRIRAFASLTEEQMQVRLGEHWTVAVMLTHLAFWDRRAQAALEMTQAQGKLAFAAVDVTVNDLSLPIWAAVPAQAAARLALAAAEELDHYLETYPDNLLEEMLATNPRWVDRALHRNTHLDEAAQALHLDL